MVVINTIVQSSGKRKQVRQHFTTYLQTDDSSYDLYEAVTNTYDGHIEPRSFTRDKNHLKPYLFSFLNNSKTSGHPAINPSFQASLSVPGNFSPFSYTSLINRSTIPFPSESLSFGCLTR
ncbi:hypothetical protein RSAG8_05007, partial [Rhizoctonia solani AG-8 WAC10335]